MSADLATSTRLRSPNILTLEYSDASPLAHQWAKELQGKRNKLKHVFIRDLRRLVKFDQTDESMWVFLWAKVAEAMLQQTKNSDQTVMLDLINSLASATGTEMLSPSFSRDILRLTQSVREVASKFLKLSNDSDSSETFCGVAVLIDDKSDSDGRIRQALSDRYDRQDGVQTSDREDEDDVNSLLPITSDELGVKYAEIQPFIDSTFAYHDRQVAMAEVLYKRVLDIYQFHFKKDPKDIFNAVEFRIYTAKFKTLEMQTRSRVMNADAGLIPRVLSSGDAEQVSKYCKKRVRMYSLDQKSNAFFEEFKKEVEDNPKTLYIVVADECHWDITGGDQAHNLLINEWITRGKEVLNVFVVQVSATPYNVLTVDSRLPDVPLSSLVTSEDTERELHVADWSESDAGQDYSVCKLMVTCSAPNKWLGIGHDGKLETCRQDLASSFRFQRQGTSLTEIWTHEENPRVVRAHRIPGTARYEIKVAETDPDENQLPFEIVHEFGVGIIAIRFRVSDQWLYWCVSETGVSALNSTAKITAQPRSRMTVKRTMMMPSKFNFLVMEQERSVDGLTDQAANTVYVSLNYYFNSMSDPKTSRLRADPFLQEVVRKLEKDTQTAQPVDILAADYAYHFLVMASSYANSFVTQEGGIIAGDSLGHSKLLDKLISKFEAKLPPNQPLQEAFRLLRDEVQRNVQERFEEILATIDKRLTSNQQSGTIRFSSVNELEDSLGTELAHQFVNSLYAVALYRVANVDSNPNSSDGIAETVQFLKAKRTFRNSELLEWLASKGLQGLINDLNVAKGHDVMVGETGKVVFDLFRSCFDAGKPIQGEMIVVRVLRIQDGELFRDALMTARNVALQHTGVSGFVVLCDYGNVKKKNVSHAKEGKADKSRSLLFQVEQQHPRLFDCLQRRRCNTEIGEGAQCPCHAFSRQNEKLKCSNCLHVHRRIDQYEQLQNVPSILILAGRGRMGNTFPSSFTCLDLRVVRKEGQHLSMTLSTLAQELGTLCRYSEIRDTDYKPYALLSGALFSVLQEHRKRNSSFFALDLPAPDKHMKEKSDCFEMLKKLEQRKQSCQHFHETTVGSLRWYDHKAGENSYDFRHTNDQLILKKNRLVFQAEPQIGKTGVYLYLIRLLKQRIGVEEALESPFLDVDFVLNSSESTSDREATNKVPPEEDWLYPSFKQLETAKPLTELDVQPRTYGRDTGLPVNLSLENRKETVAKLQSDAGYEQLQHSQREMTAQAEWLPSDKEFHTNTFRASRVSHRTGCKVCSSKLARLAPPDVFESVTLSEIGPVTVSCPKSEIYAKPKRFLCGDEELSSLNYGTLNNPDENGVRFWIFNPSYKRSTKALLNYRHVMVSDDQKLEISYIQAIVVRSCEFEVYVKYWGRTHMIVQLPDSLKLPTELKQATGLDTADQQGGVGYSRLFIQLFAAALKLDFVFMLDDNIPYFAEIDFEKMSEGIWPGAFLPVKYCPFAKCLRHLQTQMDATAMRRQALPGSDEDTESLSGEDPESLTTYTGPPSRYAVVGILCKRPVSRTPFKRTPVCSVSLLNVEATIDKRVFYTPVCVREDLMFNYDCESQNLWVCKYSRFIHAKCQFVDWRKPLLFKWEESTSITSESSLTYDFPKNEATALIGFVSEVVPNYSRAFVGQMSYLDWGGSLRDVADKELVKLYLDDIRAACPGEGSTGGCGRSLVVLPLFFTHGHACGSQFLKTCIEREIKSNTGSETDNFLFLLPAKVLKDVELTTRRQITEFFTEKLFCGVSAGDFSVLTFRDPTKSAVGVVIVQVSQPGQQSILFCIDETLIMSPLINAFQNPTKKQQACRRSLVLKIQFKDIQYQVNIVHL